MFFFCLKQDLRDIDGFSGWWAVGQVLIEWAASCCLNQDLQDFDGLSGWWQVGGGEVARGQSKGSGRGRGQGQGVNLRSLWGGMIGSRGGRIPRISLDRRGRCPGLRYQSKLWSDLTRVSLHFLVHVRMIQISMFNSE